MALIDVDARMFDPARRPDALIEAAEATGLADFLDEEDFDNMAEGIAFLVPGDPDTVAEYLDATSNYFAILAVGAYATQKRLAAAEARLDALED